VGLARENARSLSGRRCLSANPIVEWAS